MSDPLLSHNEAVEVLEKIGCPVDQLETNRDILYWLVEHSDELKEKLLPTPVEIMKAFFPHNPQNVRDSLE